MRGNNNSVTLINLYASIYIHSNIKLKKEKYENTLECINISKLLQISASSKTYINSSSIPNHFLIKQFYSLIDKK